jgi:hypothetical protein
VIGATVVVILALDFTTVVMIMMIVATMQGLLEIPGNEGNLPP